MPPKTHDLVLTDTERRIALRRIIGFDRLSSEELAAVAKITRRRQFAPGAVLASPDEPRASIHFVLAGDLVITRALKPWPVEAMRPTLDLFWLARDTAPLELRTRTGALTLELPVAALEEVFDEHFPVWQATTGALAGWLLDLGAREAPARQALVHVWSRCAGSCRLTDRLSVLRAAAPFASHAAEALVQLAEAAEEVHLPAGQPLWRAGDPSTSLLVPIEGALRGLPYHRLGTLGGAELLSGQPRRATVEILKPLHGLSIGADDFFDVLEDHHDLARDFVAMLAALVIRRLEEAPAASDAAHL